MNKAGDSLPPEVGKIIDEAKAKQIIEETKSTTRSEMISRMTSLLSLSFRKALSPKSTPETQQRWFTISAYLVQVMARVVRDLEYEKIRAEVDALKKQVSDKFVGSVGRAANQT